MRVELGDHIKLSEPLPTRCCSHIVPAGEIIEIFKRNSQQPCKKLKAVIILHGTGLHTVRTSKIQGEKLDP